MALLHRKFWYFNIRTGKAEHGRLSRISELLGPYRTRQEAEHAYDIARKRNAAWLAQTAHEPSGPSRGRNHGDAERETGTGHGNPASLSRDGTGHEGAPRHGEAPRVGKADEWLPWQEFLDEPARQELTRERRSGAPGAPDPVADTEGDMGAASDPHDPNSFERQLAAFNRRHARAFERESDGTDQHPSSSESQEGSSQQ